MTSKVDPSACSRNSKPTPRSDRQSVVAAFHPGAEDLARLKRGGARRDRDGVWWSRANAVTDEAGRFFVDGLPSVQMRVHAGGRTEITQPGSAVLIRTGNP